MLDPNAINRLSLRLVDQLKKRLEKGANESVQSPIQISDSTLSLHKPGKKKRNDIKETSLESIKTKGIYGAPYPDPLPQIRKRIPNQKVAISSVLKDARIKYKSVRNSPMRGGEQMLTHNSSSNHIE